MADVCSTANVNDFNETVPISWMDLPVELWLNVFQNLPKPTILFTIRNVCKLFRALSLDPDLWHDVNMTTIKETTTTLFLPFEDEFQVHGNEKLDRLTEKLILDGNLTNSHLFCPVFDHISASVLKLKFSRYYDDFVLGEKEKLTLYSCVNLCHLDVSFCEYITSTVLKDICENCRKLQVLVLDSCKEIGDEGIKSLQVLQNLKTLDISHCASITDLGLSYMAQMPSKLKHFMSDGVLHISDGGLALFLSGQKNLETLILDGEDLTDIAVNLVASNLPKLTNFQISFCNHLSDQSFESLHGKVRLKRLCYKKLESEKISNSTLANFFAHQSVQDLQQLTLADCLCIENSTLHSIALNCPKLEDLTLQWCPEVTDEAIEKLILSCRNLKQLNLVGVKMLKGHWLNKLELHLPKLKMLDLSFCNLICDEDVYNLVKKKPDLVAYTYFHEKVDYLFVCNEAFLQIEDEPEPLSSSECAGSQGANVDF